MKNIFGSFDNNPDVSEVSARSQVRTNHENLMSTAMANEFNTYRTCGAFNLAVDVDPLTPDSFEKGEDGTLKLKDSTQTTVDSSGVRSLFNKLHAVPIEEQSFGWRLSQNMPLIDSPKNRQKQRTFNSCTVRDLVQKSQQGLMGTSIYDWSDFMYCKYLGRVSNNYLITLRRFGIPVADYVKPYGNPKAIAGSGKSGSAKESTQTDNGGIPLGCMVTWMGTPGNEMSDILKYNFSQPFKETKTQFEDNQVQAQSQKKDSKGGIGAMFGKAFQKPAAQHVGNMVMPGVFNRRAAEDRGEHAAIYPHYDANRAYAGVDMIKSIYVRDADAGLKFNQEFSLTFDYELRSYDGVNGKQAMLDLLGHIFTVCYTQGDFWHGTYRQNSGASSFEPLSSLECMKHHDTFSEYVGAFEKDFSNLKKNVTNNISKDPIKFIKNMLDNLGGLLMGGDLETLPPAQKQGVNSLISDSAIGQWHVTVGNPCAPIMSIGNLILDGCDVQHYGPLGIDDFPTGLKVVCKFKSGKPRDKRLIERMYNGGNDRIYMPLDQTVFEELKRAQAINDKQAAGDGDPKAGKKSYIDKNGNEHNMASQGPTSAKMEDAAALAQRLQNMAQEAKDSIAGAYEGSDMISDYIRVDLINNLNNAQQIERIFGTTNIQALAWAAGELNLGNPAGNKSSETTEDPTAIKK